MEQVQSILRKSTINKDVDRLNIITYSTHERYQTGWQNLNMNFYLWQTEYAKPWKYAYAPLPKNHIMLNGKHGDHQLPYYMTPDLILSQNKLAHYQKSFELSKKWNIPLVCLEHTLPMPSWPQYYIDNLNRMNGDLNIYISEYSKERWGTEGIIIEHGVDHELFSPNYQQKNNYVLSIVNDWKNRDEPCGWTLWTQISGYPNKPNFPIKVVGDNPGLSIAPPTIQHLINEYNTASIFLNTSQYSPIPTVILEAMSCGLPIVSTNNCMIPEVITHGEEGFLSNNVDELKSYCIQLLKDSKLREEMGNKARKKIIQKFSMKKFEQSWNKVLRGVL